MVPVFLLPSSLECDPPPAHRVFDWRGHEIVAPASALVTWDGREGEIHVTFPGAHVTLREARGTVGERLRAVAAGHEGRFARVRDARIGSDETFSVDWEGVPGQIPRFGIARRLHAGAAPDTILIDCVVLAQTEDGARRAAKVCDLEGHAPWRAQAEPPPGRVVRAHDHALVVPDDGELVARGRSLEVVLRGARITLEKGERDTQSVIESIRGGARGSFARFTVASLPESGEFRVAWEGEQGGDAIFGAARRYRRGRGPVDCFIHAASEAAMERAAATCDTMVAVP